MKSLRPKKIDRDDPLAWIEAGVLLLFFILCGFLHPPGSARADEILVSAAASLTDALRQAGAAYESGMNHKVKFNFGPSNFLARQIQEGAPADLFFAADLAQMDLLEKNRLLEPETRKNLLTNQLVIVVPLYSKISISAPDDLLKPNIKKLAIADPEGVPAGVYSRKYLNEERLWDKLKPKIIPVLDVRAALAAVEAGNVEAGFVYQTDAAISDKIKIAYRVPLTKGPNIVYPVAVLKQSKKKDAARDFINYLLGPAGKVIFKRYGFVTL